MKGIIKRAVEHTVGNLTNSEEAERLPQGNDINLDLSGPRNRIRRWRCRWIESKSVLS